MTRAGSRLRLQVGNYQQTVQIMHLADAGVPVDRIVEIGRYRRSWTPEDVDRILTAHHKGGGAAVRHVALTTRQMAILRCVCTGHTNTEIADELHLPPNTVKAQVSALLRLTGSRDRVALVIAYLTGRLRPVPRDQP